MRFTTLGVCLHTDDVPAVVAFYVDGLGFTPTIDLGWFAGLRHPDQPTVDVCVVHTDHAAVAEVAAPVRGTVLAFLVDDVDAQHDRLAAAGVPVVLAPRDEPWGQRRAVVLDPAGTGVELVAVIPPDPTWLAAHGG